MYIYIYIQAYLYINIYIYIHMYIDINIYAPLWNTLFQYHMLHTDVSIKV